MHCTTLSFYPSSSATHFSYSNIHVVNVLHNLIVLWSKIRRSSLRFKNSSLNRESRSRSSKSKILTIASFFNYGQNNLNSGSHFHVFIYSSLLNRLKLFIVTLTWPIWFSMFPRGTCRPGGACCSRAPSSWSCVGGRITRGGWRAGGASPPTDTRFYTKTASSSVRNGRRTLRGKSTPTRTLYK